MTKRTPRTHSPGFKTKVAVAAIKGEKTVDGGRKTGQMVAQKSTISGRVSLFG